MSERSEPESDEMDRPPSGGLRGGTPAGERSEAGQGELGRSPSGGARGGFSAPGRAGIGPRLSEEARTEIAAMPARYPQARSAVMPALDLAQEEVGWLPRSVMEEVAGLLQLDPGYIEGVATFYTLFHLEPQGRHHFYVCTNLSCALRGAYERVKHLREITGATERGKPTADGEFQVTEVECLGACEYAPMLRYDEAYHYDLSDETLDQLVAAARSHGGGRAPADRSNARRDEGGK